MVWGPEARLRGVENSSWRLIYWLVATQSSSRLWSTWVVQRWSLWGRVEAVSQAWLGFRPVCKWRRLLGWVQLWPSRRIRPVHLGERKHLQRNFQKRDERRQGNLEKEPGRAHQHVWGRILAGHEAWLGRIQMADGWAVQGTLPLRFKTRFRWDDMGWRQRLPGQLGQRHIRRTWYYDFCQRRKESRLFQRKRINRTHYWQKEYKDVGKFDWALSSWFQRRAHLVHWVECAERRRQLIAEYSVEAEHQGRQTAAEYTFENVGAT